MCAEGNPHTFTVQPPDKKVAFAALFFVSNFPEFLVYSLNVPATGIHPLGKGRCGSLALMQEKKESIDGLH
jgi:hypothetical protein